MIIYCILKEITDFSIFSDVRKLLHPKTFFSFQREDYQKIG